MKLTERFTLRNMSMDIEKDTRGSLCITIRRPDYHLDDEDHGGTVYSGDLPRFVLFVESLVTFRGQAERFNALEVPKI